MTVLTTEPSKWADTIQTSNDCLFSPESAKSVEDVLSKANTRKHQKILLSAVEPFMLQMIEHPIGISILTALVKYGTVTTVNSVTKVVMESCEKILTYESTPMDTCAGPLGILFERIIYREDSTEEYRMKLIKTLKSLDQSSLLGSQVFFLATARLIILDKEFAISICSNTKAQKAFCGVSLLPSQKNIVIRFCEFVLSDATARDKELTDLCSGFVFNALSDLYKINSSVRPWKQITLLLASYGSIAVVRDMVKLLSVWPDIFSRSKTDDYAKILVHLLSRSPDVDDGVLLVKAIFESKEDFDERLTSRKSSQLRLLATIAGNPLYMAALSKAMGESLEKKLLAAAVRYRNATKPRFLATKEVLSQRLDRLRSSSNANNNTSRPLKRPRE